jgi:RND family efflux transporter MFP subunit
MNSRQTEESVKFSKAMQIVLPILVIVCGVLVLLWLLQTSPKAKPRKKDARAVLVEVETLKALHQKISVQGMGTVQPALEVELKARVNGEIIKMHEKVLPGGHVKKGDVLFQIDPTDYENTARQLLSEVEKAKNNLEIERGNQLVAQKEFELLGEKVRPEEKRLILRQPQLRNLTATLDSVRARYEKAKLDIERTTIRAPFNGVIQSRMVNIGSQVNTSTPLVHLVGTDEFWIEVSIPVKKIRWLNIPDERSDISSQAVITSDSLWGAGMKREGLILRLAADLEEKGRMAKLLVKVDDPLLFEEKDDNMPSLLLGSFVEVDFEGKQLQDVVVVKRKYLRDGNYLWLMDKDKKMRIKKVDILYKDHDEVFISGVSGGERLIVSNVAVPAEGLPLRLGKENNNVATPTAGKQKDTAKGRKKGEAGS